MNDDGTTERIPSAVPPDRAPTHDDADHPQQRLSRRRFMLSGAAAGLAAGATTLHQATAQQQTPAAGMAGMPGMNGTPTAGAAPALDGFVFFTPFQARIVAAAAARLIPTDNNGPGATEAGVVYFIDRQLQEERVSRGFRGQRYDRGPFLPGAATQGDQSALDVPYRFRLGALGMDAYAQQLYKKGFADLTADQQDRILRDMEQGIAKTFDGNSIQSFPPLYIGSGTETEMEAAGEAAVGAKAFFNMLLQYTQAGFFADPVHGGNRDMVGWKLIGFPGAQAFVYDKWILRYGEPFTGGYKSLADYQEQFGEKA